MPVLPKAYGAGDVESLPIILQRSVYFCLLHCVPLTALLLVTPTILDAIGVCGAANTAVASSGSHPVGWCT